MPGLTENSTTEVHIMAEKTLPHNQCNGNAELVESIQTLHKKNNTLWCNLFGIAAKIELLHEYMEYAGADTPVEDCTHKMNRLLTLSEFLKELAISLHSETAKVDDLMLELSTLGKQT